MAKVATVEDLLTSLDYDKTTAEQDILAALRDRFHVPPTADLAKALQRESASDVLAAILGELRPFAYMILDIYSFLADAVVRTEGNLEVHVPLDEAHKLKLDLKHFREFEKAIIGSVSRPEFDPGLLPKEGQWRSFHDGYWPPYCAAADAGRQCSVCPEHTLGPEFTRFKHYFELLDQIAADQLKLSGDERLPSPTTLEWDRIRRMWADCQRRTPRDLSTCPMENEWTRTFFRSALREFDSATRIVAIEDIRRFLALPYWKQRWQFYEVWFVTLLLKSYGLSHMRLKTHGRHWTLAVGRVDPEPVAVSQLESGDRIEFYYQYQGIPPSALFRGTLDRPEVLVQQKDLSGNVTRILLAAEVKARNNFGTQDMKAALFSLQEWEAEAIVGANYYSMGSDTSLSILSRGVAEIVAADECVPRSACADELAQWMAGFWKRKLGNFVSVILIDTSGSMPEHLMLPAISHLRTQLKKTPTAELLIATFSDSVRFHPAEALDNGSLTRQPSGGTALAKAVRECQSALATKFPTAGQFSVHVLSDLDVEGRDIEDIIRWSASTSTSLRIYTWPSNKVTKYLESFAELENLIEWLPG